MTNYQRNLNRLRGFCDGAGARGMRADLMDDKDYEHGYRDGQKAKREYCQKSAAELGVQLYEIRPL
jgi:hypothetical protein